MKRRRNKNVWLCEILFVACLLRNPSGTTEGIMNSHVNLSPIKLLVKGSVSRNDKAQAHQSHAGRASVTCSAWADRWFLALTSEEATGQGGKQLTSEKTGHSAKHSFTADKGSTTSGHTAVGWVFFYLKGALKRQSRLKNLTSHQQGFSLLPLRLL